MGNADIVDYIERLQQYKRLQAQDIMNLGQQIRKLEVENERLRAALAEIADDPTGVSAFQAELARRALANEQKDT